MSENLRYDPAVRAKADRPVRGHKGRVVFGAKYNCECGWESSTYYGKGAQGQAANEFYYHKLDCVIATAQEAPR